MVDMDTSCDGLPGLVVAAPEDDGPAGGAAPVAGEVSAEDVARSATPTDGDKGKKTPKAAPKQKLNPSPRPVRQEKKLASRRQKQAQKVAHRWQTRASSKSQLG